MSNAIFEPTCNVADVPVGAFVDVTDCEGFSFIGVIYKGAGTSIAMFEDPSSSDEDGLAVLIAEIDCIQPSTVERKTRKPAPAGKTKKEIALELRQQYPDASRKEVIEMLVEQANMSKAGAATYYQNYWRNNG